jgi:[acyl-carrier-protein] S-malonyltransferase
MGGPGPCGERTAFAFGPAAGVTVGWLFPGQGSQRVGMLGAWCQRSAPARAAVDEAEAVLGLDLGRLMAEGPAETLDDTVNQQPAVLAASVAILRGARAAGQLPDAAMVAGHSLGEFGALVASQALSYPDALRLVRERGRLMGAAGRAAPGRMVAVLGLPDAVVEAACRRHPGCQVANYNAPGQVVISGAVEAVEAAAAELEAAGAKRLARLPITIAAHSQLMAEAAAAFAVRLAEVPFEAPTVPVVQNRTGAPTRDPGALRAGLAAQLTSGVQWSAGVRAMIGAGVRTFYEVGPGTVLAGLVRRIARELGEGGEAVRVVGLDEPPEG